MDCNAVLLLTGSVVAFPPSLSLRWANLWSPDSQELSEGKGVSYFELVREELLLDERSFGLTSDMTNNVQVSIWSRSHRVDLDEKKVSIEWEVSRGSIPGGEGVAGSILWEPSDYAVDVYLTE